MAVTNATATPAANCVVKADSAGHISISWIADNAVTLAKLATQANNTILGNNTGSTAAPSALSAASVKTLLSLNNVENTALSTWVGTTNITTLGTIGSGTWHGSQIAQAYIEDAAISLAKMANLAADTIIGNNTAGATTPKALSTSDVRTLLGLATTDSPTFAGITISTVSFIKKTVDDDFLIVTGATDTYSGGAFQLYGEDQASHPGDIYLIFGGKNASPNSIIQFGYRNSGGYTGWFTIDKLGNAGLGTASPAVSSGTGLDMAGSTMRLRTSRTPASASATGNAGEICWDSSYIYVCTATNTWKRVAIATW